MTKADIAREWRAKYPDTPNRKLARMMYNKCKTAFKDEEDARGRLRYIEGQTGPEHRKAVIKTEFVRNVSRPVNPYKLPESYAEDRTPFKLPLACDNILLISDLHIPYHDLQAITIALDYGVQQKVNTVFINGDLIDNSKCSRFESDPRKRSPKQEFDATREFLVALRNTFPSAEIYWLKGNHCIRWEKFLLEKASEIWDDPYFHLEERLGLNNIRVKLLDDKRLVKAGKLSITHGHLIMRGFFSPVNSARGVYMKAKQSTIIGHVHKHSSHSETDMDGNVITTYSTGSLCELKPDYSPMVANYQHGFAHITVQRNGDYNVRNFQIIKGKLF